MCKLNKFSYMLKLDFHSTINLPEYRFLVNEMPCLRPVFDKPILLECASHVGS
jgi:hypothetical protein